LGAIVDASLAWILIPAIGFAITFAVVHAAVRSALSDHYKTVRWYEKTGEWDPRVRSWKHAPREFPDESAQADGVAGTGK
jgi:hypothetical protein